MKPGSVIALGFFLIIVLGVFLLCLPVSKNKDAQAGFLDCVFVTVSAVCVTGLTTVDIATSFTVFGRGVLAVLIQLGGLGFATFALFIMNLMRQKLSLSALTIAKESINFDSGKGIVSLVRSVIRYAFLIEFAGAILLFFPYYRRTGNIASSAGMGLFHSISAFNNAGFDLNGGMSSLISFHGDIYVNTVIMALILLGGLGFFVIDDIVLRRRWNRFSFHTKIVLTMTAILFFGGAFLFFISGNNILDSLFLSVTARTAGFTTIPCENFSGATTLVMIVLMFIGANPGSTGGGVKTTTVFVVFAVIVSVVTNRSPHAFQRRFKQESVQKALAVFLIMVIVVVFASFGISLFEGGEAEPIDILFEVVSAAGTVGLSRELTPALSTGSRILIMIVMFLGRLGPLSIVTMLTKHSGGGVSYIEEHVMIG